MASQPRKLVAPSMRNNWRKWRAMLLWSRTGSELSVPIVLSILVLKLFLRMQFYVEIVRNCLGTWPISVNIFSSIQHVRASCTPGSWCWTRWHVRMLRWLLCPFVSLEGWYQEYVAKRAAMGVILNYKEANNTASCLKLTSNLYSLSLISLSLTKLSLISLIFYCHCWFDLCSFR